MAQQLKTVKVSAEHHRALKIAGIDHGVSLQQYLAFILELSFSEDPLLVGPRNAYWQAIQTQKASVLDMVVKSGPPTTD